MKYAQLLLVSVFTVAAASDVVHAQIRRPAIRSVSFSGYTIISTLLAVAAAILFAAIVMRWWHMRD